jgi:hypothetical protein
VRAIGFDYDFTLVTYRQSLLKLLYKSAAKHLAEVMQVRNFFTVAFALSLLHTSQMHLSVRVHARFYQLIL